MCDLGMAGEYSKDELKEMLQRATFKIVAKSGIESITVRKITEGCNLTAPYIYQCYADIPELLRDSYFKIDKEIAGFIGKIPQIQTSVPDKKRELEQIAWIVWNQYWDYLMKDADRTIFYWRFYQSGYYNSDILIERQKYYRPLLKYIHDVGQILNAPKNVELQAVITSIIDDTASIAVKIHLGYISKDALTIKLIYRTVFSLLFYLMEIDIWEKRAAFPETD